MIGVNAVWILAAIVRPSTADDEGCGMTRQVHRRVWLRSLTFALLCASLAAVAAPKAGG